MTRRTSTSIPAARSRVAFLGLGAMGAPMAKRIAAGGRAITLWNRTEERARAVARAIGATGTVAKVASSPREAASEADAIVIMVSDARALRDVIEGAEGIARSVRRGAIVIDMSTSGRAAARRAAKALAKRGARFVDAPVSGTVGPAERGELLAMAGGRAKDLDAAAPVLACMCRRVIHAGGVGQGQALKVLLNGVGAHHFVAFTSMLALGERAGLSRATLVDAFTSGAFASPSYVGKKAKVLARDWSPEFSLALAGKDAALNLELQREVGLSLPVVRAIAREVGGAIDAGLGELDLYAIERWFATRAPVSGGRRRRRATAAR